MEQNDSLYERARQILQGEPEMGKKRLADRLGVRTPTSRRLLHRFRGETQGHSNDQAYQKVRVLKDAHPDWGAGRVADQLGITVDHAMMHLARWLGAQSHQAGGSPSLPSALPAEPAAPADGAELQISGNDESQAMSYRGSRIKTIEDLLAFSKTDTKIWEVEKHVINKWEVGAKDPLSGGILTEPLYQLKLWLRWKVAEQRL
jgi:hypothetical protein